MHTRIIAVIITYNPKIQLLNKEYESIASQVNKIIYVDNCSNNINEIREWKKDKKEVVLVCLDTNEGIGFAQNVGIGQALEASASHIVLLDQDSVVDKDFVVKLYKAEQQAIKDGANVGLTGPVYRAYGDDYIYPVWSIEDDRLIKVSLDSFEKYSVVSHIISSGSLIRREVIEVVGSFREDLFIGYIDFEYCFRAASYGYVSIVTKHACMHHQMGDSQISILGRRIGLYSPFRRYFDCRNTLLIQKDKVFPRVLRKHYLKLILVKVLISLIYGPSRKKQFLYCLRGFYDGIRGKTGKLQENECMC